MPCLNFKPVFAVCAVLAYAGFACAGVTGFDAEFCDPDNRTRNTRNEHTYFKFEVKLTLVCCVAIARNSRCRDYKFVVLVGHAQFVVIASKHFKSCNIDNRTGCSRNLNINFKFDVKYAAVCRVAVARNSRCCDFKTIRFVEEAIAVLIAALKPAVNPKQVNVYFRARRPRNSHRNFKFNVKLTLVCCVAVARNNHGRDYKFVLLVSHAQFVVIARKHTKICNIDNWTRCARNGYVHLKINNKLTFVCSLAAVEHCVFSYRDQA